MRVEGSRLFNPGWHLAWDLHSMLTVAEDTLHRLAKEHGKAKIIDAPDQGSLDGFRVDRDGNLWSAAGDGGAGFDGVHCYSPDGEQSARRTCPARPRARCHRAPS